MLVFHDMRCIVRILAISAPDHTLRHDVSIPALDDAIGLPGAAICIDTDQNVEHYSRSHFTHGGILP